MSARNQRLLEEAGYVIVGDRAVRRAQVASQPPTIAPAAPPSEPCRLSESAYSRLGPEQKLQVDIVERVRPLVEAKGGKLLALNGELPGGSRLFKLWQAVRRAMGYQPGTPDLMALSGDCRVGFLELKRDKGEPDLFGHRKAAGQLSTNQIRFRDWCQQAGYGFARVRTVDQAKETLTIWQMIEAG